MKRKIGITNFVLFLFGIILLAGCGKKEAIAENDNECYIAEYRIFHMGAGSPYLSVFNEDGSVYFAACGKDKNGSCFCWRKGRRSQKK